MADDHRRPGPEQPPRPGDWYWIDNTTVHYRPHRFWTPETTLTVTAKVYGLNLGGGVYGAEDHTATYLVHDSWIATADGVSEQMQIRHNGALVKTMPVSLGVLATRPCRYPRDLGQTTLDRHGLLHLRCVSGTTRILQGNREARRTDLQRRRVRARRALVERPTGPRQRLPRLHQPVPGQRPMVLRPFRRRRRRHRHPLRRPIFAGVGHLRRLGAELGTMVNRQPLTAAVTVPRPGVT